MIKHSSLSRVPDVKFPISSFAAAPENRRSVCRPPVTTQVTYIKINHEGLKRAYQKFGKRKVVKQNTELPYISCTPLKKTTSKI
jgi:hypothetical protein